MSRSLLDQYDGLLVDLDGVVHLGDHPIPAAAPALSRARDAGCKIVFVTNNASKAPAIVAAGLTDMGVQAAPTEVQTSSMAAAEELRGMLPAKARVLIVGGAGLRGPVADAGLLPVASADDDPAAVVQGWSPDLTWALLAEGAVALRAGVPWVATNRDATLPSPRGPLPGNGAMVATLVMATGREPIVVGKPEPGLFTAAVAHAGLARPLVVGDRLDTDIAGATRAGLPSLLVLTGVSGARDLLAAPPPLRPTYVGRDLSAVTRPGWSLAEGADGDDELAPLRAAVRRAWSGELAPDEYDDELKRLSLD